LAKTIGELGINTGEFLDWYGHAQASIIVLSAIARARVLDHLGDAPRSAAEMAADAGFDAKQLGRLLAFLGSQGVLAVDEAGRYAHSDFSRMMRTDHPASLQAILSVTHNLFTTGEALPQALATGQMAQQIAHGQNFFEMLREDPVKADDFSRFMTTTTALADQFIFTKHVFMPFGLAIDVGGNHGSLLLRLLADQPQARGILFDLPEVIAQARPVVDAHPCGARVETASGSFFESVPAGGDLYLLKQILHDWEDEKCVTILRAIRAAIAPGGRLVVMDRLLPEQPRWPHPAYQMDLYMMLLLGARERKLSEFESLFAQSDFRLDRVTEDPNVPCVIEAVPV
jgi:hypothetical protein